MLPTLQRGTFWTSVFHLFNSEHACVHNWCFPLALAHAKRTHAHAHAHFTHAHQHQQLDLGMHLHLHIRLRFLPLLPHGVY